MKYSRFVHIILRDGKIKAVLTSRIAALKALQEMRDNAMPALNPEEDFGEYMKRATEETYKWHLEKWAVCKTMST